MTMRLIAVLSVALGGTIFAADPLVGVPFTEVKVDDVFWKPRITTNRDKSLAHNFKWCEETGRINNFLKAAGKMEGKFEGIYFNDSDVYKVLEGAAYSLADRRDPDLEKQVDEIVAKIAAAQQPNGYLNTYFTLVEPNKRWVDFRNKHELYCGGHMVEGAVAHYRATGKRNFLDVAVKWANHLLDTFGPDKRHEVPGHEEVELALVKLAQVTGDDRYFQLAKFFIDIRGDKTQRKEIWGPYHQDHMPLRDQSEVVGHAVRAMYLFAGAADVARQTGDPALMAALDRLWKNVVEQKLYITAGIGARHAGEAFGEPYELPNASAYCETCAAIGLALWAHRLNLLHADAQYADVLERAIYNGILSGIALEGEKFFYVNPLASSGGHHRQPFFGCACCPTNVVRFVPSVPGYVYAQRDGQLYVNLYMAGKAKAKIAGTAVAIEQETKYPWEGKVRIAVSPEKPATFAVLLRIPQWTAWTTQPGWKLTVCGQPAAESRVDKGYVKIERAWKAGDAIELEFCMDPVRVVTHPSVTDDAGRVAIQRGPIVYCFEAVDNPGIAFASMRLAKEPKFRAEHRSELLGGVTVLHATEWRGKPLLAIPYYAWDHRAPGAMAVWVRQDGLSKDGDASEPGWKGVLYRPLDPHRLGVSEPLSAAEQITPSASHCHGADAVGALNDGILPKNSNDHNVPRFTWWDHRGTREWVQYDFEQPQKVSAVSVYWFNDEPRRGQCRPPKSWRLLYRDGDAWKPVQGTSAFETESNKMNRTTFPAVTTTGFRIEAELQPKFSGGILEWQIESPDRKTP